MLKPPFQRFLSSTRMAKMTREVKKNWIATHSSFSFKEPTAKERLSTSVRMLTLSPIEHLVSLMESVAGMIMALVQTNSLCS